MNNGARLPSGSRIRVEVNRNRCIGSGLCVAGLPMVFDQDEDTGTVILLVSTVPADLKEKVRRAVRMCPGRAIHADEMS